MNYIQSVIKEICDSKNIKFNLVSKDWIMILEKESKIRYIVGYKFDLNNHAVGEICDDKYALFDTLKHFDIPVADYFILFKNYDKNTVLDYFKNNNYDVVVKSNTGTCGNDMYHIKNETELFESINKLLSKNFSISISPYYNIKCEYRTIVLNGKVLLFYGKKKPIVIGNGKETIYELLCKFNKQYFEKIEEKEELTRILDNNEIYQYNWQFNLSKGASAFYVEDEKLKNKVCELALRTAEILNLKFASIDIIELDTKEILVLEANSGVMMENISKILPDGKLITKKIYEEVVEEMFK